ncbi:MAG TPA: hypothetical protein VJX31_09160, partial [Casimicrobiaceae bacterium]|nr:hypothetical protein [Casimicrobiaceae bacterium]
MTPEQIEQVFGRGRLKMATGEHVEVFREAMMPGERRRYTKRFLATSAGDFGPWTAREWRILARLIGHGIQCVPDVVQFDGGAQGGARLVQTYDAGITVDQWGTLLPVARRRQRHLHIFEDCAHWWSLAHHCLVALDEIHALGLVHLDIKGDNICIPYLPSDFDPGAVQHRLYPEFRRLALIDFAFSLVSREALAMPLPIGWQKDYDYQSPRLLHALDAGRNGDLEPTRELDWRCDLYSLAAMLKRYLPSPKRAHENNSETGWSSQRYDEARTLILRLRDSHDSELPQWRPHAQLIDYTSARLSARDLTESLADGWALAQDTIAAGVATPMTPITPMTRLAPPIDVPGRAGRASFSAPSMITDESMRVSALRRRSEPSRGAPPPPTAPTAITAVISSGRPVSQRVTPQFSSRHTARHTAQRALPVSLALAALLTIAAPSFIGDPERPLTLGAPEAMNASTMPLAPAMRNVAVNVQSPPTDAAPPEAAPSAAETPRTESVAAAMQPEPEPVGLSNTPAEHGQSPQRDDATQPTDSTLRQALAPSLPLDTPSPSASPGMQLKSHGVPPTRAQLPKRSSKPAAKPADASGKAYAANARHYNAQTTVTRARVSEPVRGVDVAGVTTAPLRPAQNTIASSPPAGTVSEGLPRSADAPSVAESGAGQNGVKIATMSAPAEAASAPANSNSAAAASSVPSAARADATQRASVPRATPRADWRTQLATLFGVLRDRAGPAAPVEDRMAQTSGKARTAVSRPPAQSTIDALPRTASVAAPAAAATSVAAVAPSTNAPITIASPSPTPSRPATISPPYPDAGGEPRSFVDPSARAPLSVEVARPPPAETPSIVTRVATPPRAARDEAQVLTTQARRLLADTVPRVASMAEPEVSRVLSTAAIAIRPAQVRQVIEVADRSWPSESAWVAVGESKPEYARRLHEQALRTLTSGGRVAEALDIELQAFGANPQDPDIAGYLAFLYLQSRPARPEI